MDTNLEIESEHTNLETESAAQDLMLKNSERKLANFMAEHEEVFFMFVRGTDCYCDRFPFAVAGCCR